MPDVTGSSRFHVPTTVDEALEILAADGTTARLLAGGTDLMIQLERGEVAAGSIVSIGRLEELADISANGSVTLGTLASHRRLAATPFVRDELRAIAEGSSVVGGWQTQAVGTIGGNICNASPAADLGAPLLVNDASVRLRSVSGDRLVPYGEFVLGRRSIDRRPDELVVAIEMPRPAGRTADVYLKVGRRDAMEIAIVGLGMRLAFDDAGSVSDARIALAAVTAAPRRFSAAEAAVIGRPLDDEGLTAATAAILAEIAPIDDVRSSADYRRRVIPGLARRAAITCATRCSVSTEVKETTWS